MTDKTRPEMGTDPAPPSGVGKVSMSPESSEVSRILARWMDSWIRIPGTHFKIGLDPILSLFPMVGDFLASSAGLVLLLEGLRLRVSALVLLRMGFNLLLNAVLNLIPVLGALGSAAYKSNNRNLELIQRWQAGHAQQVRRSSLFFLINLVIITLLIAAVWLLIWLASLWLLQRLMTALGRGITGG